jgi:hypothetical protein
MSRLSYIFKEQKKKLIINFFSAIGVLWTSIECTSHLIKTFKTFSEDNIWVLIAVVIVSIIYAVVYTLPKRKIKQNFTNLNTAVNIEIGNLLDKEGNVVIGSSNYFDTKTSKTDSLKTQLINKFFNNSVNHLDNLIDISLDQQGLIGQEVDIQEKPNGKRRKYEIGTTADITLPSKSNTNIFISVICEVVYNGQTKSKISDFRMLFKSLEETWKHIRRTNNNKDIYVPILGAGVTGLSLSKLTLIQLLVFSFLLNSKESKIGKSLNIIIPESNYDPELFQEIENYLKTFQI